ncbi:MAG: histidine phosphotransferase family protein [Litoreibacter sp.]|uniref:histidine phosphotransferase family protein n=1 Tax=Litoreibacter sp. TaxID=1969459 RepID=UPI0032985A64
MSDKARSNVAESDFQHDTLKDATSLLASRICHDLISPIGAISNGLELLMMSGLQRTPELELIEESISNANARVRLFRLAFGSATAGQRMARSDIVRLLGDCYKTGRIQVMWEPTSDVSRIEAKVALLGVLCLEVVLPAGGKIVVREDRGQWQMQAYGTKIRVEENPWSRLNGAVIDVDDIQPAHIQFVLLREALDQMGKPIMAGYSDSAASLRYEI